MIKNLTLRFGQTPASSPLTIPVGSAVVIVGPNNSGKSRLLQEIEHLLKQDPQRKHEFTFRKNDIPQNNIQEYLLLKDIEPEFPQNPSLLQMLVSQIETDLPQAAFASPGETPLPQTVAEGISINDLSKAMDMLTAGKLVLTSQTQLLIEKLKGSLGSFWATLQSDTILKELKNIGHFSKTFEENIKSHQGEAEQALRDTIKAGVLMLSEMQKNTQSRSAKEAIIEVVKDGRIRIRPYLHLIGPKTLRLDGRQRLEHVRPTALPTKDERSNNPLTKLLKDTPSRELLRQIVHEAFDDYLSIDVSSFQKTELKMSAEPPGEHEFTPLKSETLEYFQRARSIDNFSDGVKSFVGLLSAVLSDEYVVMLIDEPEAFLHPPLARRLGQKLHQLSRKRGAHILAATHSSDFLMGCIQASPDVNIVRLTYRQGIPTARLLPVDELQQMMMDPLLRSTGTLSALFHEGAIVCEGDRDRAFYQEINERLLQNKEGADGCLFMNAHSKQAIHRVIKMLRRMGIPAAAVVDLDLIIDENTLKDLLTAVDASPTAIKSLGMIKGEFFRLFVDMASEKEKGKALLKSQGIKALSEKQRQSMISLFFKPLAEQGIFVVPEGEVESWLSNLHPEGGRPSKSDWLDIIFEALGSDPHGKYIHPGTGDVWDFMRGIAKWIGDPNREGLSSHEP
ncbi:AAA family ATPase [Stigmatella sp. ncwal1]|uniref:AAA family ATPase n=1 Tax=Stigmatella ashevillensis TaxID=2995309 RepID=A0ABT5D4K7_9BACT|nr:AAA family ATPase [Stigmatella ashevillena]MDC0708020.1 AAA family ATPase [Stigmatella ashevillena]